MRALILLPTDSLGGAENVMKLTAAQICACAGNTLHVVFMSRGDRGHWSDLDDRARLHFIDAPRESAGVLASTILIWRLSRQRFDIAISSHLHCNGFLGTLRRFGLLRTRKLVVRESTLIGERFAGWRRVLLRAIYNWCYGPIDMVVCQTPRMREALWRFVPRLRRKAVVVLPNPVDAKRIRSLAVQEAAIALPSEYIVAVGRLVPVKGYDLLLRAFARAMQDGPQLSLVLLGEGAQRPVLEQLARELNIADRVVMPGHISNPSAVVKGARFAVVSSRIEGFPNVVLEMLAVGVPVVATRCTDGLDQLPNVTLCATEDVPALAAALSEMYSQPLRFLERDVQTCLHRRSPRRFLEDVLAHAGVTDAQVAVKS